MSTVNGFELHLLAILDNYYTKLLSDVPDTPALASQRRSVAGQIAGKCLADLLKQYPSRALTILSLKEKLVMAISHPETLILPSAKNIAEMEVQYLTVLVQLFIQQWTLAIRDGKLFQQRTDQEVKDNVLPAALDDILKTCSAATNGEFALMPRHRAVATALAEQWAATFPGSLPSRD